MTKEITPFQEMMEAFLKASANFKTPKLNMAVKYTKKSGQVVDFKYADLGEMYSSIKGALLNEGFVITHEMDVCIDGGHSMYTYLQYKNGERFGRCSVPIDFKANTMQDVGSQITYMKRYSLASICAVVAEEDDDASSVQDKPFNAPKKGSKFITPKQVSDMKELCTGSMAGIGKKLMDKQNITKWEDLKADRYIGIYTWLKNVKEKNGEKK